MCLGSLKVSGRNVINISKGARANEEGDFRGIERPIISLIYNNYELVLIQLASTTPSLSSKSQLLRFLLFCALQTH